MAKTRRSLLRFFIITLLLVTIPIVIAPFLPLNEIKPAVESKLSDLLGRRVTVGSLRLSLFGGPFLYINQMTVQEDPTFADGTMLQANQVRADFSLLSFVLHRRVEIDSLKIQSPDITFVKSATGVWSWTTLGKSSAQSKATSQALMMPVAKNFLALQNLRDANINNLTIEQATVRLLDPSAKSANESLYRHVGLQAHINRQGNQSHLTGTLRAQSEELDGAELLQADMPFDLTIARTQPAELAAQGNLGPGAFASKNFSAERFQSNVEVKGNAVKLEQLEMALYEGAWRGTLQLDLATQRFTANGEAQNINLDQALASKLQMPGQVVGNINAQFQCSGLLRSFQEMLPTLTGDGRISANRLFISSVNLSQQVAQALKLKQIGDMNAGTELGAIAAEFHLEQGAVKTRNLHIQQLDGLGEATAEEGWLQIGSPPTCNYTVTVLLSNEATQQVKTTSPLIGVAVAVLEVNNRIAVPVNISGEVQKPQVVVDVKKLLFGF
ncbi:MAG: AsmA family protein [Acidobacteria bacterium]|nr:AsmA family protein [Acidobacteriota bacterium]